MYLADYILLGSNEDSNTWFVGDLEEIQHWISIDSPLLSLEDLEGLASVKCGEPIKVLRFGELTSRLGRKNSEELRRFEQVAFLLFLKEEDSRVNLPSLVSFIESSFERLIGK